MEEVKNYIDVKTEIMSQNGQKQIHGKWNCINLIFKGNRRKVSLGRTFLPLNEHVVHFFSVVNLSFSFFLVVYLLNPQKIVCHIEQNKENNFLIMSSMCPYYDRSLCKMTIVYLLPVLQHDEFYVWVSSSCHSILHRMPTKALQAIHLM